MSEVIRIDPDSDDDRFSRFGLIGWWDQERLASARVLVIGAGALGNEIVKNLALLGVGRVVIADLDQIESSNLSRSVLYRPGDVGRAKADVAAERAREIYAGTWTQPLSVNVVYDLGLGIYRWADVILGGLDNREARVAINRGAARAGKAWIDGAIERLDGVARVFDPANGPCYECTMSEVDWQMLEARRSCALLNREDVDQGKTPTTPTTSSVIAGIQVQEAVKQLHGVDSMSGQGFVFEGTSHQSYLTSYAQLADCPSHEVDEPVKVLPRSTRSTTVGDLLEIASSDLGGPAVLEFNNDLLSGLTCVSCGQSTPRFGSLGSVREAEARCESCGEMRRPEIYHTANQSSAWVDKNLGDLGVPLWDVIPARSGSDYAYYEFAGDQDAVLGPLAGENTLSL